MKSSPDEDCADAQRCSCTNRYKRITERLYRCLDAHVTCRYKICLGNSSFCSWLLRNDAGCSEHNFPCSKEDQT